MRISLWEIKPEMKKLFNNSVIILLTSFLTLSSSTAAAEQQCHTNPVYQTTSTFVDIENAAYKAAKKTDLRDILMVFDIDNTLLAMDSDLGSDQWFDWQYKMLKTGPTNPALVAEDFPGLLTAQNVLWNLGEMSPPEEQQPVIIKRMQAAGFTSLLLTSRGPEAHDVTIKALLNNGYDFSLSTLPPLAGYAGTFFPYNRDNIKQSGITTQEAIAMELAYDSKETCLTKKLGFDAPCLHKPRGVKYANGVFLTAGQNKGAMLRTILAKTGHTRQRQFSAIVYADDKVKHVKHIHKAFCHKPVELLLFHYVHEEKRVEQFEKADKSTVISKWKEIEKIQKQLQ